MEVTSIQVKLDTKKRLTSLKLCDDESYDNVLKRVLAKVEA